MATDSDVLRLTTAFERRRFRRAAALAALVAAYYRQRVSYDDPQTVERWLQVMVPRIMREDRRLSREAAEFANVLRRLEVPGAPAYTYAAQSPLVEEQVRESLKVVGPGSVLNKAREIQGLPEDERLSDVEIRGLIKQAERAAEQKITGAVTRHAQAGARHTIQRGQEADPAASGYVRVVDDDPCYFCAMLASRGVVFSEESFDASDPRFTGPGDAKVHDHCGCGLKPIYRDSDPFLQRALEYENQWYQWGVGSGAKAILNFRRGFEGREHLIEA